MLAALDRARRSGCARFSRCLSRFLEEGCCAWLFAQERRNARRIAPTPGGKNAAGRAAVGSDYRSLYNSALWRKPAKRLGRGLRAGQMERTGSEMGVIDFARDDLVTM